MRSDLIFKRIDWKHELDQFKNLDWKEKRIWG